MMIDEMLDRNPAVERRQIVFTVIDAQTKLTEAYREACNCNMGPEAREDIYRVFKQVKLLSERLMEQI